MKAIIKLVLFSIFSTLFISCEKNNLEPIIRQEIQGLAQKGPYLVGSSISIYELNKNLAQTGKSFSSQITDNKGNFSINLELTTSIIEIKVDGFYFNEVSGEKSSSPLTLYALSDISDKTNINCNIISSLEKDRVKYLITKGYSFSESKTKAKSEILGIFNFSDSIYTSSELLDISKAGDENAMLLAISLILQGYGTVADLSELIANISNDIKEDGTLDNQNLGSILINNTIYLRLPTIRQNIEKRYLELGVETHIPNFEKYIKLFLDSTHFVFTEFIKYPTTGKFGLNILDKDKVEYASGSYSMKAILPEGTSLQIKIAGSNWFFPAFQDNTGWNFSDYNMNDNSRVFTATQTGEIDFQMSLGANTTISAFENGATSPTWSKEITIK